MKTDGTSVKRLEPAELEEHFAYFMQSIIGKVQSAFRTEKRLRGLSQKDMADRLGKKPEVISRALSGQSNLTIKSLHNLARSMDCRLEITVSHLSDVKPSNRGPLIAVNPFSASNSAIATPTAQSPLQYAHE